MTPLPSRRRTTSPRACCVSIRASRPFSMPQSAGPTRRSCNSTPRRSGSTARPTAPSRTRPPTCARAMNARERALHRALTLWHGNDNLRAVEALEAITTEWPSDLLTAKIAEFLYYVLGQQYMGPRFRAHVRRLEGAHAGDPDFLAMAAFASELCGDYVAAEAVA